MERIRTLIVDDEELARLRIRKLLQQEVGFEIVGECDDGDEALNAIRELQPQLVFLDIQMQRVGGFELLARLDEAAPPAFVFVTAYDRYAVQAFEANAFDYLLKPYSDERFYEALQRARERIVASRLRSYGDRLMNLLQEYRNPPEPPAAHEPVSEPGFPARLVLKTGNRLIFLDEGDVDWVEAEGVYVRVHAGQKSHLLRESLSNVEQRLSPRRFVRIHRSTLVNVARIKEIVPHLNGGSVVVLHDGKRLKMSRSYRDRVNATLG